MSEEDLRRTPLYEEHKSLGARLVDFAGWEMPVQYEGIKAEHIAVRNHAGLFDVSHMGEVVFRGPDAEEAVQGHPHLREGYADRARTAPDRPE